MSFALIFSGQGGQHPEMLSWLQAQALPDEVACAIGADWRTRLLDPTWAGRNSFAQVLLTGLALAAWEVLEPHLGAPAALAGYSVGEVAAFCAAGVYGSHVALELARQRAACMDAAAQACRTGLVGVTGLAADAAIALCRDFGLELAICNGINSVVLGGPRDVFPAAMAAATALGARCTLLNVALASHTGWMAPAARDFASQISSLDFLSPRCPLFANAEGRIAGGEQARGALARQIAQTVRWDECMDGIAARQVSCVLEIGPGQALARMWNQRYPHIPARSVDEFRSLRAIVDWVHRQAR